MSVSIYLFVGSLVTPIPQLVARSSLLITIITQVRKSSKTIDFLGVLVHL